MLICGMVENQLILNSLYSMIKDLITKWENQLRIIENTLKSGGLSKSSEFEHKSRYITIQEIIEDLKMLDSCIDF